MRYFIVLMLLIVSCKSSTEKQEEPVTEQEELNETLPVQEEPVVESAADKKLALMQGTWYSTDDPKSYMEVTNDQLVMGYEGDEIANDAYAVTIADQLPGKKSSNPDKQYLILKQGEDTMTYAIDSLTEDTLKLLYLPRGNFLSYSKTQ